jgi:hypothetical protein
LKPEGIIIAQFVIFIVVLLFWAVETKSDRGKPWKRKGNEEKISIE